MLLTISFLLISNIFMTFAWYGHLKNLNDSPLFLVILISWGIAFFEYCFQVPANRIGNGVFTLSQLKILQEVISITVFCLFSYFYMKIPITKNFLFAGICLLGAVFFIFKDVKSV